MTPAEEAILSVGIDNPELAIESGVKPDEFSDGVGRTIWTAIINRATAREPVDIITLAADLGESYRKALGSLGAQSFAAANVRGYAQAVKKDAKRRHLRSFIGALDLTRDPDEVVSQAMAGLIDMQRSDRVQSYTLRELMSQMVDEIERVKEATANGGTVGVPTGIADIDALMGGWHRSDLVCVAARPAMGKTAFMLSSAMASAKKGYRVGIVSAEMAALQLAARALSGASEVKATKIRNAHLSDAEYRALVDGMGRLADLPVTVMDPDRCKPSDVLTQAHVWTAQGLDVLWVDYLQLLNPDARNDSRAREVGEMAKQMKSIAKSLDIPVIALAQLNRDLEKRANKRPMMSDLRDSGEIEEACDAVLFLYREHVYDDQADPRAAEIIVGKNRHGPLGDIPAVYLPERLLWGNADVVRRRAA